MSKINKMNNDTFNGFVSLPHHMNKLSVIDLEWTGADQIHPMGVSGY